MTLNIELAERVLTQITEHPETHDQVEWCGSRKCVAGWACTLNGDELFLNDEDLVRARTADGDVYEVSDRAATLLGLDGHGLFYDMSRLSTVARLEQLIGVAKRQRDHDGELAWAEECRGFAPYLREARTGEVLA